MPGTVGWYRKDFHLPDARARMNWLVRFESVNYRAKVWLNGKPIGRNTGAYLPFELRLPRSALKRSGVNRLVVRVDNRRLPTDFPPSGLTGAGDPAGGWWNYGGILREVYLQRVDRDRHHERASCAPSSPARRAPRTSLMRVTVRNYADRAQRVAIDRQLRRRDGRARHARPSPRAQLRDVRARASRVGEAAAVVAGDAEPLRRATSRVARRRATRSSAGTLHSGIRSIKVVDGHLLLNGRPLDLRGVGLHEDDPMTGFGDRRARAARRSSRRPRSSARR